MPVRRSGRTVRGSGTRTGLRGSRRPAGYNPPRPPDRQPPRTPQEAVPKPRRKKKK